jgi:hypothetical protein
MPETCHLCECILATPEEQSNLTCSKCCSDWYEGVDKRRNGSYSIQDIQKKILDLAKHARPVLQTTQRENDHRSDLVKEMLF